MTQQSDITTLIHEIKSDLEEYLIEIKEGNLPDLTPVYNKIQHLSAPQQAEFYPLEDLKTALEDIERMLQDVSTATQEMIQGLTQAHKELAHQAKGTAAYAQKTKGK